MQANHTHLSKRNVAILLFDNAEVLDFAGPFEVFAVANASAYTGCSHDDHQCCYAQKQN